MADDIEQDIIIRAEGSAATASIESVNAAFKQLGASNDVIRQSFTSPYEHAGMFLFSRQVLGLAGLGDIARHAMAAITLGLTQVGEAAGIAGASLGPVLLAIGGGIAIFEIFEKSAKKAAEAVASKAAALVEDAQHTQESTDKLNTYQTLVGQLPAALEAVRRANIDLYNSERDLLKIQNTEKVALLEKSLADLQATQLQAVTSSASAAAELDRYASGSAEASKATTNLHNEMTKGEEAIRKVADQLAIAKADLAANAAGFATYGDQVKKGTDALQAHDDVMRRVTKDAEEWLTKANKTADQVLAGEERLLATTQKLMDEDRAYTGSYWDQKTATAAAALDTQLKNIADEERKALALVKKGSDDEIAIKQHAKQAVAAAEKLYDDKSAADTRAMFGLQATLAQDYEKVGISAAQGVGAAFGDAVGKMAVEGKNAFDTLKEDFKSLAESIIADLVKIIAEYEIMMALTGGTGLAGGGVLGAISGAFGAKKAATGFSGVVSTPTMFLAGEGGESEYVSIVPQGKAASSAATAAGSGAAGGGAGGGNLVIEQINVVGVTDPKAIADQIGNEIIRSIRGRGQLGFLRTA